MGGYGESPGDGLRLGRRDSGYVGEGILDFTSFAYERENFQKRIPVTPRSPAGAGIAAWAPVGPLAGRARLIFRQASAESSFSKVLAARAARVWAVLAASGADVGGRRFAGLCSRNAAAAAGTASSEEHFLINLQIIKWFRLRAPDGPEPGSLL